MELAKSESTEVARPLRVLVPLIKDDLEQARKAGMPYYQAAGAKMLEAKEQLTHGEFRPWLQRNFAISHQQAGRYMALAKAVSEKTPARAFSSLNEFQRETGSSSYTPNKPRPQAWHEPVKEAIGRVNVESLKQDALAKQEERTLQRKLALALIDIGFKALATRLHPDKGGSREAMARLNRVRKILQEAVTV